MEAVNAKDRGLAWERNLRCAKVTREFLVLSAELGKMTAALWRMGWMAVLSDSKE